jgi:hypothetical protein
MIPDDLPPGVVHVEEPLAAVLERLWRDAERRALESASDERKRVLPATTPAGPRKSLEELGGSKDIR